MKKPPVVEKPLRDPDHISKRGVHYYFAPEWCRGTDSTNTKFGKIKAVAENANASLYMVSKELTLSYIQGSIQEEFRRWHQDRQIYHILLGETPEAASALIVSETEDTKYE